MPDFTEEELLQIAAGHPEPKFDIFNNFVRVIVKGRETER